MDFSQCYYFNVSLNLLARSYWLNLATFHDAVPLSFSGEVWHVLRQYRALNDFRTIAENDGRIHVRFWETAHPPLPPSQHFALTER